MSATVGDLARETSRIEARDGSKGDSKGTKQGQKQGRKQEPPPSRAMVDIVPGVCPLVGGG